MSSLRKLLRLIVHLRVRTQRGERVMHYEILEVLQVKFRWKFLERFFFFLFFFSFQAFDIRRLSVFLGLIVVIIRRFIRFERFNRIADNEASSKRTDRSNLFKIFCFVCFAKKKKERR